MNLLYQRVGGHEGISKLLRHFYADVRQDPLIGPKHAYYILLFGRSQYMYIICMF
jgi:truncated hemoglobin YjbI